MKESKTFVVVYEKDGKLDYMYVFAEKWSDVWDEWFKVRPFGCVDVRCIAEEATCDSWIQSDGKRGIMEIGVM